MANTYKLEINRVECKVNENGLDNVVYGVWWTYSAEDENGNIALERGTDYLEAPDSSNFTPFEELTQEVVVGWIESNLKVDEIKANLDAQIAETVAPTFVTMRLPDSEINPQ